MMQISLQSVPFNSEKMFDSTELALCMRNLPKVAPEGPWIAGGALRRCGAGESMNGADVDFFFSSVHQFMRFKAEMELVCKKLGGQYDGGKSFGNHNWAIPLAGATNGAVYVQAISNYTYRSPKDLIDSFDFTICQFATDGETLFCGDTSIKDTLTKILVPCQITHAISSLRRIIKYHDQGYRIENAGIATFLGQIAKKPNLISDREDSDFCRE